MAVPFGGHPRLREFVEWATSHGGCTAQVQTRTHSQTGQPFQSLEMTSPSGAQVALVDPDPDEYLAPSEVAYLHRRLGIKSPFPGTPEPPKPDDTDYVDTGD